LRDNPKTIAVTKSLLFRLTALDKRLIIINLEYKLVDPYGITNRIFGKQISAENIKGSL